MTMSVPIASHYSVKMVWSQGDDAHRFDFTTYGITLQRVWEEGSRMRNRTGDPAIAPASAASTSGVRMNRMDQSYSWAAHYVFSAARRDPCRRTGPRVVPAG
jgi:hypothetical protein